MPMFYGNTSFVVDLIMSVYLEHISCYWLKIEIFSYQIVNGATLWGAIRLNFH